jgi:hypothetical protein
LPYYEANAPKAPQPGQLYTLRIYCRNAGCRLRSLTMFWLIKKLFWLSVLAGAALFVYFVPIEGETLYERVSGLVQKQSLQEHLAEVQSELATRIKKIDEAEPHTALKKKLKAGHDEISEADKKSLDKLLRSIQ